MHFKVNKDIMDMVIGTCLVRVPVSYLMSKILPVSLFRIGLATPCSSFVQIVLCLAFYFYVKIVKVKKVKQIG